ncbi:Hsp70 family protein [Solwaraspora sp. WMMD406]|uniref:Hsp70 family protein n=1 Tax=Solwaraspora sp. WMMD406 TaxID=3016095 RepID=UPI00241612FD|nr:Hsp70 family protein [Solwaraspora sp. WMMD406]MDG4766739.1 Hsp70 family protein [Solwaraspora sp. WMMD406]
MDAAIVSHLGTAIAKRGPADWFRLVDPKTPTDRRAAGRLWENVRAGKEMLARTSTTTIHVPLIEADVPFGREELDQLAAPLLERTVDSARSVLADVELGGGDLAAVFLTGGATRMPAVATVVHRGTGVVTTYRLDSTVLSVFSPDPPASR